MDSSIYNQLVAFQIDLSRHELTFISPTRGQQLDIQTLAPEFDLDVTYSTITNIARVTRRPPFHCSEPSQEDVFAFLDFTQLSPPSSEQVDIEFPSAYDAPPSAAVDWNDLLGVQDAIDWNISDAMPTPELELPEQNSAMNNSWLRSPDLDPAINNTKSTTSFWDAQQPLDHPEVFPSDMQIRRGFEGIVDQSRHDSFSSTATDRKKSTETDIRHVLSKYDMSEYFPAFLEQGFDTWEAIVRITESDFDALGVKLGHRRRFQGVIDRVKLASEPRADTLPTNTSCTAGDYREPALSLSKFDVETRSTSKSTSKKGRKRVTNMFSKRKSTQEESYPGYQVWDSRSSNSASSSISSAASGWSTISTGRKGALSGAARTMANAVKAVKACWRCKFMRKPVRVLRQDLIVDH
jgi:hypothetical protein